jgi:hypothetical protein
VSGLAAAGVRALLGAMLIHTARYDQALAVPEQAVTTYQEAKEVEGQRRTLTLIGQAHANRGTPDEGLRRVMPLLDSLSTNEPSPGLAALDAALAQLCELCEWRGWYGEALPAA